MTFLIVWFVAICAILAAYILGVEVGRYQGRAEWRGKRRK